MRIYASIHDCTVLQYLCVCEAVKDIRTDVELKKNKVILAAQWPFCGVTILHYMLSEKAVIAV
jgi:hypothetical protein